MQQYSSLNNYFFVDGSALLADVRRLKADTGIPSTSQLKLVQFAQHFTGRMYQEFHGNAYRRFVFYFVKDDERLRQHVLLPDFTIAGGVSDVRVEWCGKRITQFEKARTWLDQYDAPDYVRECLYRSEKAVDTQISCDALQLAGTGKLDRLFLYTNDYDFVPLCRALRQLGGNINLFRLRAAGVNGALAAECDALHEVPESLVSQMFVIPQQEAGASPSGG